MAMPEEKNRFLDVIRLRPYTPSATSSAPSGSAWYESLTRPFRMGNTADIAYGGCALAVLTAAAFQHLEAKHPATSSSSSPFTIYSASGLYLRPALCSTHFVCEVTSLRSTRTFETMQVKVYQPTGKEGGALNVCNIGLVDFMRRSANGRDNSILTHSLQPRLVPSAGTLTHHTRLTSEPQGMQERARSGELPQAAADAVAKTFSAMNAYTVSKLPPEGIWQPAAWGAYKSAQTGQEDRPVPERVGYDWAKIRGSLVDTESREEGSLPISQAAASASLIVFFLDGALSFSPLSFTNRFLDDAAACASLDFAIRFHREDTLLGKPGLSEGQGWFLREIKARESAFERTYNEGVLWEEMGEGEDFRAVATMTQACVLKAKPKKEQARL